MSKHRHATGFQSLYLLYWNQNNTGEKVLATCAATYVENINREVGFWLYLLWQKTNTEGEALIYQSGGRDFPVSPAGGQQS